MVAIVSRRAVLTGTISIITYKKPSITFVELDDVVDLICTSTPKVFREGVMKSGDCFLYRGDETDIDESNNNSRQAKNEIGKIRNPLPDLLLPGTYEEKEALSYFECLERELSKKNHQYFVVRPSVGHIGTPRINDASAWGNAVSVWPLGTKLSYAWPDDRNEFFPLSGKAHTCPDTNIQIDHGLEKALRDGREILFTSWFEQVDDTSSVIDTKRVSTFVVVSSDLDGQLRKNLQQRYYGM